MAFINLLDVSLVSLSLVLMFEQLRFKLRGLDALGSWCCNVKSFAVFILLLMPVLVSSVVNKYNT
jgi:hypothetical protein